MNKILLVGALSLMIVVGILVLGADPLFDSIQVLETGPDEEAAPAVAVVSIPVAEDDARFDEVADVLNQSKTGSQLLKLKEKHNISVQFEDGQGSRFRKSSNLILLDGGHEPAKAALYLAHELIHAQTFNEGKAADIDSESRESYINLKIQEEVKGMMASFLVKMELEQIGVNVAGIAFPMEDIFRNAYQAAIEQAKLVDSSLSTQQLEAIGQAAGAQALFDAFASGEIRTSNTHEPYTEYFAGRWEEAHEL